MSSPTRPATPTWLDAAHVLDPRRLLPAQRRPPADSLAFYAALAALGLAEIVEWPAVLIAAAAQALLDRRVGHTDRRLQDLDRRVGAQHPSTARARG